MSSLISILGISGDCTTAFLIPENMGIVVGIVSIYQFLAKLQVLPFNSFPVAILDFLLISMLHIIAGCTIEFLTPKNMGVAVGISSLSSTVP